MLILLANFKRARITKVNRITTKEIMAPFFSINIAWGKFQERDASFRLVLNRKASLRMVCSAQHHLITIFKQQIRGVGRTFHRGEGPPPVPHLSHKPSFVCQDIIDWRLKVRQLRHNIARLNLPFSFSNCATSVDGECWL